MERTPTQVLRRSADGGLAGLAGIAGILLSSTVHAQPVLDYGMDWVTVGDPGNRPTNPDEVPLYDNLNAGAVDYRYRLSRTEVNNIEMLEFVRAYAPFWDGHPYDLKLTTRFIDAIHQPDGSWDYQVRPGAEHWAAQLGWETAARYCNWLTNGKVNEAWAFERGAYDTSTFTENDDGSYNHQAAHTPGALYWIPTLDELIKGAYWDPDKDGVGGYWTFPDGSNTELIEGFPEDGGQTIGDLLWETSGKRDLGAWDLAQYPDTQSPWGLLDVSGTYFEWTETPLLFDPNHRNNHRMELGSVAGDATWSVWDRIDMISSHSIRIAGVGGALRLGGAVPPECRADLAGDGALDASDVQAFLAAFADESAFGDWDRDDMFDFFDVQAYLNDFAAGCP